MFWNRILFMVVSFVCDCLPHTHAITKSLSGISASPIYNAFNYTSIIMSSLLASNFNSIVYMKMTS